MAIKTSDAHKALKSVVNQLDSLNANEVNALKKPKKSPSPDGLKFSETGPEWRSTLRHALVELQSWCEENSPGEPFTIEVPPQS